MKKFYQSKTVLFGIAVLATGGLDLINSLIEQTVIDWRSVALTATGLIGIAIRLVTKEAIAK